MKPEELKQIAVFRGVDSTALTRLAAGLEEKTYAEGETVFAEGAPGDAMFFILSGRIRIEKRTQSPGGPGKLLTVLEPSDYFGEMALLDQEARSASALAAGPAKLLRLSKAAFEELQRTNNVAAISVLFAMIRTSNQRIRRLSAHLVVYDEVGRAMGEARTLNELLETILQQLSAAVSADWGLVVLRCQFSDVLELRCQSNVTLSSQQSDAVKNGQGFIAHMLQNPQDQLFHAFGEEEPFKSSVRLGFETPSMLCSPITLEGQLLGLIVLGGSERAHFDLDALNLARGVARQTAQAILNARHREEEEARSRHSRQFVRF
jgi:CRP-like cAMP-binding protein